MSQQLLRRAWDALDSFKQAYPENWHEDDEQVMKDLMRTDMKMSGVQPKWVGLTDEEVDQGLVRTNHALQTAGAWRDGVEWAIKQLQEKNT
jgi:hypothetical protein